MTNFGGKSRLRPKLKAKYLYNALSYSNILLEPSCIHGNGYADRLHDPSIQ